MPAPVRYRSTAVVYAAGGADMGTTRAPYSEFDH